MSEAKKKAIMEKADELASTLLELADSDGYVPWEFHQEVTDSFFDAGLRLRVVTVDERF